MNEIYAVVVTIHLLAAFLWLGGMFFLAAVGAPTLRSLDDPGLRRDLFRTLGERFRTVGWWAIAVLIVTGVLNLHLRGVLRWETLTSSGFWSGGFGRALFWKLMAVAVMLGIQGVHDFVHGPAAGRIDPRSQEAATMRRRAALLARVNAVAGILLVYVAVHLARGGM